MQFNKNNIIFFNNKNIIIKRFYKKFNNKRFDLFKIFEFVNFFYRIKLLKIIRIYNVFYIKLLNFVVINLFLN